MIALQGKRDPYTEHATVSAMQAIARCRTGAGMASNRGHFRKTSECYLPRASCCCSIVVQSVEIPGRTRPLLRTGNADAKGRPQGWRWEAGGPHDLKKSDKPIALPTQENTYQYMSTDRYIRLSYAQRVTALTGRNGVDRVHASIAGCRARHRRPMARRARDMRLCSTGRRHAVHGREPSRRTREPGERPARRL